MEEGKPEWDACPLLLSERMLWHFVFSFQMQNSGIQANFLSRQQLKIAEIDQAVKNPRRTERANF